MAPPPEWLKMWLIACSSQTPDALSGDDSFAGAISFRCSEGEYKIDIRTGMVLEASESVTCWIEGGSETFSEIASGALNLQKATVTGQIRIQGNPIHLLAFSKVVDAGLRIQSLRTEQLAASAEE